MISLVQVAFVVRYNWMLSIFEKFEYLVVRAAVVSEQWIVQSNCVNCVPYLLDLTTIHHQSTSVDLARLFLIRVIHLITGPTSLLLPVTAAVGSCFTFSEIFVSHSEELMLTLLDS